MRGFCLLFGWMFFVVGVLIILNYLLLSIDVSVLKINMSLLTTLIGAVLLGAAGIIGAIERQTAAGLMVETETALKK